MPPAPPPPVEISPSTSTAPPVLAPETTTEPYGPYPRLMQLRQNVRDKYILGTEIKFLPANKLEELVTRDVVLSAFKETGMKEGAELERLIDSVLTNRQR